MQTDPETLPELCTYGAVALSDMIRRRQVSAAEIMTAYLDHIDRINPAVNAIVSLRSREAIMAEAHVADEMISRGEIMGPLHGLPQAVKDLANTRGLRTTFGSPLFAEYVPERDAIYVARMRRAGAIIIGKTNVPEFGLGSNSYNPVFGLTRNAYDLSRVAGGSSGGAGVALALRMLPVADGSDMGGSLRNPAAFNNVFGLRPSQGRVPMDGLDSFYGQMAVEGPMGRSIADVAMLLSVQAGYDAKDPLSLTDQFQSSEADVDPKSLRFGWLGNLVDRLPFEPGILDLCRGACSVLAESGAEVQIASIDFDSEELWQAWTTLRHHSVARLLDAAYQSPRMRNLLKPEAIWEIEQGLALTASDISRAQLIRGAWYRAILDVFDRFDFLLLPSAQVFPFSVDRHWPTHIGSRVMDSYHRWMEVVIGATMAGCPAISVPAGFSSAGLPAGLQIIGPPRHDADVLRAAVLYEKVCPWLSRLPPMIAGRFETQLANAGR